MKIRNGFVSNSSSSSFVIDMTDMPADLKNQIMKLREKSGDLSRCTGKVTNIKKWVKRHEEYSGGYDWLKEFIEKPNIIIIRESDEDDGFEGFSSRDIRPYVIKEFEYH
jgi:hypothetical protein